MRDPLISIALCTYNGERFVREQLDSLVNQTYKNIEIIAVDDHSSDQTFAILENYKSKFKNIRTFQNNANLGFRKNFEKALRECTGEYIALSDQDDVWRLDKIAVQMNLISEFRKPITEVMRPITQKICLIYQALTISVRC